jgi:hypothetical protein
MPIVIRPKKKMEMPKSKADAFKEYKDKEGYHHKADPKHPMNAERTTGLPDQSYKYGGGKMKVDPVYAKAGCKVLNNR